MKADQRQRIRIPLGNGKLFSSATLATWKRAVTSRGLAMEWAKGQLVNLALSMVVLIFGVGVLLELAVPGFAQRNVPSYISTLGQDDEAPLVSGAKAIDARDMKLRDDLFEVPKQVKKPRAKDPKTNPVELLRLVELQGVLGGSNPRAMVLYKRTKETVTVSVGDDLGEFEVVEIRERSVVLKWRNELFELSL